ncbi:MAG: PAS domain-containing protein, partial [Candidatus Hodarchaeales archaeon]
MDRENTDRKITEEQLRYQASLLDNVSDAVISTDKNFIIKSWNKAAENIYGWCEEEVLGKGILEVTQLDYPYDSMEEVVNQFFKEGIWRGEVTQRRKDGTLINILTSVSLIKDENGSPIAALAVNRDITDRKKAEEKLRESEEQYRLLFDNTPVGIGLAGEDGTILANNQYMLQMLGYSMNELKEIDPSILYNNPLDQERIFEILRNSGQIRDYELQMKRKDGTIYDVLVNIDITNIGDNRIILTTARDITKRKQAEEALKGSERSFRKIIQELPLPIGVYNQNGTIIMINQAYLDMSQFLSENFEIGNYNLLEDPMIKKLGLQEEVKKVYRGKNLHIPEIEISHVSRNGNEDFKENKVYSITMFPVYLHSEQTTKIVVIWKDISYLVRGVEILRGQKEETDLLNIIALELNKLHSSARNFLDLALKNTLQAIEDIKIVDPINHAFMNLIHAEKTINDLSILIKEKLTHSYSLQPINVVKTIKRIKEEILKLYPGR